MKLRPKTSGCNVRTKKPTRQSGKPACRRRSQTSASAWAGSEVDLTPLMIHSVIFCKSKAFMPRAFAAQVRETSRRARLENKDFARSSDGAKAQSRIAMRMDRPESRVAPALPAGCAGRLHEFIGEGLIEFVPRCLDVRHIWPERGEGHLRAVGREHSIGRIGVLQIDENFARHCGIG